MILFFPALCLHNMKLDVLLRHPYNSIFCRNSYHTLSRMKRLHEHNRSIDKKLKKKRAISHAIISHFVILYYFMFARIVRYSIYIVRCLMSLNNNSMCDTRIFMDWTIYIVTSKMSNYWHCGFWNDHHLVNSTAIHHTASNRLHASMKDLWWRYL